MIENQSAITGIKQILAKFSDQDVISLCVTVTQGLLKNKIQTREDAINGIIKYSKDPISFLRRKLVTRNHLFEYLDESGFKVQLPITKDELICTIIDNWINNVQIPKPQNTPNIETNKKTSNTARENEQLEEEIQTLNSNITAINNDVMLLRESQVDLTNNFDQSPSFSSNAISLQDLELMSLQFCEWFYTLMNQSELMGREHFYPDASIQIQLVNDVMSQIEEVKNDREAVTNLLFKIKSEHNLFFNPNINKYGTRGKLDPHGLVSIMCCGTLHINNVISGVFEQMFALARDPTSENNWKIKNTKLVLRSQSGVTNMPQLCSEEILQIEKEN